MHNEESKILSDGIIATHYTVLGYIMMVQYAIHLQVPPAQPLSLYVFPLTTLNLRLSATGRRI